jgi:hypothetical protein
MSHRIPFLEAVPTVPAGWTSQSFNESGNLYSLFTIVTMTIIIIGASLCAVFGVSCKQKSKWKQASLERDQGMYNMPIPLCDGLLDTPLMGNGSNNSKESNDLKEINKSNEPSVPNIFRFGDIRNVEKDHFTSHDTASGIITNYQTNQTEPTSSVMIDGRAPEPKVRNSDHFNKYYYENAQKTETQMFHCNNHNERDSNLHCNACNNYSLPKDDHTKLSDYHRLHVVCNDNEKTKTISNDTTEAFKTMPPRVNDYTGSSFVVFTPGLPTQPKSTTPRFRAQAAKYRSTTHSSNQIACAYQDIQIPGVNNQLEVEPTRPIQSRSYRSSSFPEYRQTNFTQEKPLTFWQLT